MVQKQTGTGLVIHLSDPDPWLLGLEFKYHLGGGALTLERLWMKVRVILSMCVYSVSSSRFLCSFSLFLATSLSSISSLCSCSWTPHAQLAHIQQSITLTGRLTAGHGPECTTLEPPTLPRSQMTADGNCSFLRVTGRWMLVVTSSTYLSNLWTVNLKTTVLSRGRRLRCTLGRT